MDTKQEERLIGVAEAEKIFGCSRTTLWRREKAGIIPPRRKVGATSYWLYSDITAWLQSIKTTVIPVTPLNISRTPTKPKKSSPATLTVNDTPFIKALGQPMPVWLAEQLRASVDENGNLTYATAAGGIACCVVTTVAAPRNLRIFGGESFSICGNVNSQTWNIVENLADLLVLVNSDDYGRDGCLVLNKPAFAKRAIMYLLGKVETLWLLLGRDEEGDRLTNLFTQKFPDANDYRDCFGK